MFVVLKVLESKRVGFPFKYHPQVSAVSGATLLCRHGEQCGAVQYQVVLCITVIGSLLLPCMWLS